MSGGRSRTGISLAALTLALHASWSCAAQGAADSAHADQREGARIFLWSCAPCHSLKYVRLQSLQQLGFSEDEIADLLPGSRFDTPLNSWIAPEDAEHVFGLAPPDLSLIVKAREEGKHHILQLLAGYALDGEGSVVNSWLPGTRMPDVFSYAMARTPEWRQELERRALRIGDFLEWAADPKAGERRELGYYVIAYLIVLTVLLYLVKRRVWARLDDEEVSPA